MVAEAKFCNPATQHTYIELIKNKDSDGLMALLTNMEVENKLLERVRRKAMMYGSELVNTESTTPDEILTPATGAKSGSGYYKVDPQYVAEVYEKVYIYIRRRKNRLEDYEFAAKYWCEHR